MLGKQRMGHLRSVSFRTCFTLVALVRGSDRNLYFMLGFFYSGEQRLCRDMQDFPFLLEALLQRMVMVSNNLIQA